jgi:hypothetical protein
MAPFGCRRNDTPPEQRLLGRADPIERPMRPTLGQEGSTMLGWSDEQRMYRTSVRRFVET